MNSIFAKILLVIMITFLILLSGIKFELIALPKNLFEKSDSADNKGTEEKSTTATIGKITCSITANFSGLETIDKIEYTSKDNKLQSSIETRTYTLISDEGKSNFDSIKSLMETSTAKYNTYSGVHMSTTNTDNSFVVVETIDYSKADPYQINPTQTDENGNKKIVGGFTYNQNMAEIKTTLANSNYTCQ